MKNLINGQKPEFGNLEQIKLLQKEQQAKEEKSDYKSWYNSLSPDEKAFDDFMSIDWCKMAIEFRTEEITKKLSGRSPITIMIDQCTGYEKGLIKGFLIGLKEGYTEIIRLCKRIGDTEQATAYKTSLDKVKIALKTEYKDVKAFTN